MSDDYDTTEKLERTDTGFCLEVKSTRGTGTRDSDTVKAELRTETLPTLEEREKVTETVIQELDTLREFHPDGEDE